ncbi:MAG: hypothetical protein JXA92_12690 [candidate division Zixibacteria bacterium]|nr:hypothetical protein [candidate division Zixibacteria bacterium]
MKKTSLTAVVVVTLLASIALAQPGPFGPGQCPLGDGSQMGKQYARMDRGGMQQHKGMPGIQRLLNMDDELALSPEQKTKFEKMKTDFAMERIDRGAALEKAQVKLRDLMADNKASETNVNMAIDEVSRLKADIQKMRYNHHKQIQATLTEEQVAKLNDMRMERRKEMREQRQFNKAQRQFKQMRRGQIDNDDI